jgi:hypothetical protein
VKVGEMAGLSGFFCCFLSRSIDRSIVFDLSS